MELYPSSLVEYSNSQNKKKFGPEKLFIWRKKSLGPKIFWLIKICDKKIFWVQNIFLAQKVIWVQKLFGSKKNFASKKNDWSKKMLSLKKKFGAKIFWVQKNFCVDAWSKKFWPRKKFVLVEIGVVGVGRGWRGWGGRDPF